MESLRVKVILPLLIFFCLGGVRADAMAQRLIVHPDIDLAGVRVDAVRAMFMMRLRKWPDGTPVRVFVLSDTDPVHRIFAKKIVGVLPYQLRRAWDRGVFAGTSQAPIEVMSETEMLDRVAATPGAVGYVSDRTGDERVRYIPVD
jgi:hypothetical protein